MYDIITFGSASRDIVIKSKRLRILKYKENFGQGEGFCLPIGAKIEVEDIQFYTGGGGTNTAATFALQGFNTAFYGAVGRDSAGQEIINELKKVKVDTSFVVKKDERPTNHSIIILQKGQDRTILTYRGVADLLDRKDILFNAIKAKWVYLAPLCDLLCGAFEEIVRFATRSRIKIAVNPSMEQLSLPMEKLKRVFNNVNVLFLNKEEASFLTKVPYNKEKEIFKRIDKMCPGVAVMTKGAEGVVVSDGKYLYSAKPHKQRKVVDTTGAGDSFASGFLSDFIRYNGNIKKAIQLGMANSEGNISEFGAKDGLLKKGQKFKRVEVSEAKIR